MRKVSTFVAAACFVGAFAVFARVEVRAHSDGEGQSPDPAGQATYGGASAPQGGVQGGAATAGVFAPVLDSEKRPITAGGFVKEGPILFVDIAGEAGAGGGKHLTGPAGHDYT